MNEDPLYQEQDALSAFDVEKFKLVLRRNWAWPILFLTVCVSAAYLYVRYTKPMYESSSVVKLNFESDAAVLDISSPVLKQEGEISGEIELLKSRLFFSKVVEAVPDMNVSYYRYGRLLDDERFQSSPFAVSYLLKNTGFFNRAIDLDVMDAQHFELKYNGTQKQYQFGQEIQTPDFNLLIEKTKDFNTTAPGSYYFIINSKDALVDYLKSTVEVVPESFTAKTLKISLKDHNRRKAQVLINAIDSIYEIYTRDAKNQALVQKIAFLDERISATDSILQGFENYFENFTIQNRTINLGGDLSRTISQLDELDSARYNLRNRIGGVEVLKDQLASTEPLLLNAFLLEQFPESLRKLLEEYQTVQQDRSAKLLSYSENTFIIRRLDEQLEQSKTNLLAVVNAYHDQLNKNLTLVTSRKNALENSLSQLPALETEYSKNRRLYSQQEEFMLSLRRAKMELEITRAGTVTDIIILSPASFPSVPIHPRKSMVYAVGVMAGLVLGVVFLLVSYLLDNKVTSVGELERLVSVPIIGSVPFYRQEKLPNTRLVIRPDSKSSLSEALRTIRTNMEFMNGTKDRHTISITSTVSGEGKTFLGVNLGAIIALGGQKVIVVDLDMRKPKIHLAFQQSENRQGMSTLLAGKSKLTECIHPSEIPNLHYLPAGPVPPNPSELLLGENFSTLLKELQEIYDMVILDTPPVGLVTDGILVMKKADLQLYVVRSGYSKRAFTKTIEQLRRTNKFDKLTVIFNSLKGSSGYGYGYGYGYGSGYYEEPEKERTFAGTIKSLF